MQPVQFCNSAESYPRVYVSWTWKRAAAVVHVEDTEAENDGVCAPCCAPALKLDFH